MINQKKNLNNYTMDNKSLKEVANNELYEKKKISARRRALSLDVHMRRNLKKK